VRESNVTFVILGGTGDLAKKKLLPSLFNLYKKGRLKNFDVIGTSRNDLSTEEYRCQVGVNIEEEDGWDEFRRNIRFAQLDFYNSEDYRELQDEIMECSDHRLFYLATLPQHFDVITDNLAERDLVNEDSKVLYEKPFGDNLSSARELNRTIGELFEEDKIYRIDHYLDKELVGNMAILRFSNSIFEPILNSTYVDHVQIIASEDFGIESRGGFYDSYGAFKDFFQSHLLQLLSLVAMSPPDRLDAKCIRDEKVKSLRRVEVQDLIAGQYEGYPNEEGVKEDSNTETLVAAKLGINGPNWEGVPFYLISGKNLVRKYAQIYVHFKQTNHDSVTEEEKTAPNALVISIQPDKGIYFTINTKVPGEIRSEPARMEFCHACHHGPNTPSAYENLLTQAMAGDQRSFIRYDEIEEQWKIVDRAELPEPFKYEPGKIPREVKDFIKDGRWNDLEG